jgi:hypothetical protein
MIRFMNLVTLFFITAVAGCLVVLCSAAPSPICQWNSKVKTGRIAPKNKNSIRYSSSSIQLRYKGNEFPDMEEGRIPAWVGSDGLMRVPSALPYLTSSDHSVDSSPWALSQRTNKSPNGLVVLPGISSFQTEATTFEEEEKEESSFSRRLLKLAPLLPKKGAQTTADYKLSEFFPFPDDQDDSFAGMLVPSATHADGSDIFGFETYSTENFFIVLLVIKLLLSYELISRC